MQGLSFDIAATQLLVGAFGLAGVIQVAAPGFMRRAYQRWGLRPPHCRVVGTLELIAALFLSIPGTRIWGVVLAGLLNFLAVVMLLANREYGWAVPGLAIQAALAPCLLAAASI